MNSTGKNNFAKKCLNKQKGVYNVQQEPEEDSDCEYGLFVGFLSFEINNISNIDQEWMVNIMVCDFEIDFQLDMGVMCKVFSYDTLQKLKKS